MTQRNIHHAAAPGIPNLVPFGSTPGSVDLYLMHLPHLSSAEESLLSTSGQNGLRLLRLEDLAVEEDIR